MCLGERQGLVCEFLGGSYNTFVAFTRAPVGRVTSSFTGTEESANIG